MIKNIFILLFSILSTTIFAQEKLKSADISEFAYTIELVNNNIVGKGAKILESKISESQFLLLGEQHYSPKISEFTNAILPKLLPATMYKNNSGLIAKTKVPKYKKGQYLIENLVGVNPLLFLY